MSMTSNSHPPEQIEVITSVQRWRRWSTQEKLEIVEESKLTGLSVSAVARKHGVRVAWEAHPGFSVYNPDTLIRLADRAHKASGRGRKVLGANLGLRLDRVVESTLTGSEPGAQQQVRRTVEVTAGPLRDGGVDHFAEDLLGGRRVSFPAKNDQIAVAFPGRFQHRSGGIVADPNQRRHRYVVVQCGGVRLLQNPAFPLDIRILASGRQLLGDHGDAHR